MADRSTVREEVRDVSRALPESDAVLGTVVLLATVFHVVTTMVGLDRGLHVGDAVARAFVHSYGSAGIGLLKFSALLVVVLAWAFLPERYGTAILQGTAVVSPLVVALNAATLAAP